MPLILVDGQPLPGGERNPATALRLPVDIVERVEVMRNGTAEFPAAGPGGVINLVLRDVPAQRRISGRLAVGGQGGDGSGIVRGEGQIGDGSGNFGWLLAGAFGTRPADGRRQTETQRFTAGVRDEWRVERAAQDGRDANLTLSPRLHWNLGGGRSFTLSPFLSHTEDARRTRNERLAYADPLAGSGLAATGSGREEDEAQRTAGRLTAEWKTAFAGGGEFSARLTVQGERDRQDKDEADFDAAGAPLARRGERSARDEFEKSLALRGKRLFGDAHLFSGGAEWRAKDGDERRLRSANGVALPAGADGRARIDDERRVLWLQDEWQLADGHLLTPGLRWQGQRVRIVDGDGDAVERAHRSLDPSLHYLWQLSPEWNLRASATRSEKAPNARHLSPVLRPANGSNSSANPDKTGNPALSPERSRAVEIGAEHFLPNRTGTVGFSLFHRRIDDQVQRLTQFEGGRWIERPYNVGDATLRGGLVDFKLRADALGLPALTLRGNAARTDTRLRDPVPGLGAGEGPRKSVNLGAEYEIAALRLTLGGNFSWQSALDRESSATLRQTQAPRRQFDLYAVHRLDRQLRLRFSALNVTRAGRDGELVELDAAGAPRRIERDDETTRPTFLIALEGKW